MITWLGLLNFVALQWLTLRLARVVEDGKTRRWQLLHGIVPLSGWWSNYRYVWAARR